MPEQLFLSVRRVARFCTHLNYLRSEKDQTTIGGEGIIQRDELQVEKGIILTSEIEDLTCSFQTTRAQGIPPCVGWLASNYRKTSLPSPYGCPDQCHPKDLHVTIGTDDETGR
jgi:hypothetical protein